MPCARCGGTDHSLSRCRWPVRPADELVDLINLDDTLDNDAPAEPADQREEVPCP